MPTISAYFGQTGLTDVGYTVKAGNSVVAARTTTGITDLGDGNYEAASGPTLTAGQRIVWDSPTVGAGYYPTEYYDSKALEANVETHVANALTTQGYTATRAGYLDVLNGLAAALVNAVWGALTATLTVSGSIGAQTVAALGKLLSLGSGSLTLQSPVLLNGDIDLVIGDDYYAADNRAITLNANNLPNLTGATVALQLHGQSALPGTVITAGNGITQIVQFEPGHTFTGGLTTGLKGYDVAITLVNGHEITMPGGTVNVAARQGA